MTEREAIDRIKWKYEKCDGCNRNQIDIDTWDLAISALEKQIPKKPRIDYNGVIHKEHCPNCDRSLFPNEHHCECGQRIDFEEEIPMTASEILKDYIDRGLASGYTGEAVTGALKEAIKALEAVEAIKGMEYQYEWYDDEKSAWERGYNACLTEIKRLVEGDTDDSK